MNNAAQPPATARLQPTIQTNRLVFFAVALAYLMLLPPQLNLTIFGSVLPPYRFFLLPAALVVIGRLVRREMTLNRIDICVILATVWIWVSLSQTSDFMTFLTGSVAQTVDIGIAYMFGRAAFTTTRDLRIFLIMVLPGFLFFIAIMAVESFTRTHLLQPFMASIFGGRSYFPADIRLEMMRARGPFPHPILAGIFFASFLPLYWFSGIKGWPRILGICAALGSVFSVSSAAILALNASVGAMIYNWLTQRIANLTWSLFFALAVLAVFVAELATSSGSFNIIVRYGALSNASAYNRVLIWRHGSQNVADNPLFGIGYNDWERPFWMVASIDNYWLLLAMQYGILMPTLLAIAFVMTIIGLIRQSAVSPPLEKHFLTGLTIAIGVFALGVVSVAVWLSAQVWFFMLLGICVSLGAARVRPKRPASVVYRAPPVAPRPRRPALQSRHARQ